jgi:cytochrome c553
MSVTGRCIAIACVMLALVRGGSAAADSHRTAARGQVDYETYCTPCHGTDGGGDGPLAPVLATKPARHNDPVLMDGLSDDYLFGLLKNGGPEFGKSPLMGAWSRVLSEQRIRALIDYMRSLPDKASAAQAIADRREGASQQ